MRDIKFRGRTAIISRASWLSTNSATRKKNRETNDNLNFAAKAAAKLKLTNMMPVDSLQIVLLLLQFENMLHKKLLQIFVGIVDAKLFEGIGVEIFEAENIQNAYGISFGVGSWVWMENGCVDFFHNVHK